MTPAARVQTAIEPLDRLIVAARDSGAAAAEAAGYKVHYAPTLTQHFLFLDRKNMFADINVRKAFCSAIDLQAILGEDFARVYAIVKRTENDEFLQVISPWEREHLLLNV